MKKTKIICSIGPASCDVNTMEQMVLAGMNVARVNFSHATLEEKQGVVSAVEEVRKRTGVEVAILYDTKGPEFRNGMLENGEINLVEGKTIRIVKEDVLGNEERFSVNHPKALDGLSVGDTLLLENGLMKIEVISKDVEELLSNTYSIYPNPTKGMVTVEGENIDYIAVYNSVGQLVKVVITQSNVVDMSECENGVYFLLGRRRFAFIPTCICGNISVFKQ